ncbi:hypothetical protein [Bacillus thuringiensis]
MIQTQTLSITEIANQSINQSIQMKKKVEELEMLISKFIIDKQK